VDEQSDDENINELSAAQDAKWEQVFE